MSGGLTPCRQLRQSSRREHVKASKSYMEWKKKQKEKQTTHKSLKRESQIEAKSSLIKVCTAPLRTHVWPERAAGYLHSVHASEQAAPSKCGAAFLGEPRNTNDDVPYVCVFQTPASQTRRRHCTRSCWPLPQTTTCRRGRGRSTRSRTLKPAAGSGHPPCNHTHPPPPLASTPPWPAEVDSRGQRIHPEIAPVVRDNLLCPIIPTSPPGDSRST